MNNGKHVLTVPKLLIVWPKIPNMPQNLSAQFVCPSPKVLDFNLRRLPWASVVFVGTYPLKSGKNGQLKVRAVGKV